MRPLAIAHRGDPYAFRENTLPAFAAAVRAGADMVELDVRATADGALVLVHDETLERLWEVPRRVGAVMRAETRELGIPELAEALAAVDAPVMLDYEEDIADAAVAAVREAEAVDRVVFSGGNYDGHRRIRALEPQARIALTWDDAGRDPNPLLDELGAEFFNPSGRVLLADPGFVERMHARGTQVSVWTLDRRDHMKWALALGVDAVITNRVGDLVSLLAERAPC
ncbi:MAG TPA: glycerophosphodiester phosphodiesterase [Gaiellaceae bacterium]